MEKSNKIERSNIWEQIHKIVNKIPQKKVDGDAPDSFSISTELEELFLKILSTYDNNRKTQYSAVKIAVIESEAGWGRKIEDWMVCLSVEDAKTFKKEFNSKNTQDSAPEWYMQVEGEPKPIDLTEKQFLKLQSEKHVWLSVLNNL